MKGFTFLKYLNLYICILVINTASTLVLQVYSGFAKVLYLFFVMFILTIHTKTSIFLNNSLDVFIQTPV